VNDHQRSGDAVVRTSPGESGTTDGSEGATLASARPASAGDVARTGRVGALAFGGALVAAGLGRRSLGGLAAALGGAWVVHRTAVGRDRRSGRETGNADPPTVEGVVTVARPAGELHERWHDPEALSRVMGGFAEVASVGGDRWRWTAGAPFGRNVTWETRIVEDRPGELLRWVSIEGSMPSAEGSVRFQPAPADRGTEVTLRLRFDPPGGALGDAAMRRLGVVPDALASKALHRFKSLVETGEVPTLEANPSARGKGDLL
jgi:uncharacterized membrane protein